MQTMKLFAYQKPSRVEALLEALVLSLDRLPEAARRIRDRSELPSVLQKIVFKTQQGDGIWGAWTDDYSIWFFTAEMALSLSRERGRPTLKVGCYSESGQLREWGLWVCLQDGTWQQCAT